MLAGCASPPADSKREDGRIRVLEDQGLKDVQLGGIPFYGCSDDDSPFYNRDFSATRDGRKINGTICGGILKNWTVRYK